MRVFLFKLKRIISDNGGEFMKHFAKMTEDNKIIQWKIYPAKPQMNAICERFIRTIKEKFLSINKHLIISQPELFREKLSDWLYWYNAERVHHSLGYNTPMEYIEKHQNSHMLCDHTFASINGVKISEWIST